MHEGSTVNVPLMVAMIICGTFAILAMVFTLIWVALRRKISARVEMAVGLLSGEQIIEITRRANFFGRRSVGMGQLRGNGVLVLTASALHFFMYLPRREYVVQLEKFTGVEHPLSFLGEYVGQRLLVVRYQGNGSYDEVGFWVPRPLEWGRKITEAARAVRESTG